ncbi:MAG: ABC transporter permease [Phycisphaeraceae bacterium]|nr:ABC transporter permease [Phycisphaeraceae bacterium]
MQALFSWLWRLVPGNPQVVRIIQGASRRNQHAVVRLSYVVVITLIVFFGLVAFGGFGGSGDLRELAQAGSQIFRVVAMGQVILVCLIAPIFMAGAIASEQSGKTYAILLTTPLSNLQIVLGSLIGRLFFILALLLSGLPLFAVMLIFGGVPVSSIFVAFAVAGLTALFVGAVAVVLSVMRAGGRKAVFTFVISIAAYLIVVGALDLMLLRNLGPIAGQTTVLTAIHPLLVLEASINRANYSPPGAETLAGYSGLIRFYLGRPFAAYATITAGGSLLMILFCSLWVRRIGSGDSKLMLWLKAKLKVSGLKTRSARSLGTGNPVAWREANTRGRLLGGIIARYGFLAIGLVALGILLSYYHLDTYWQPGKNAPAGPNAPANSPPNWFRQALTALLVAEVAVITLVALYMAAGSVSKEREDGTLDIMLTTPITPRYYIWGKLRGLVKYLSLLIALPVLSLAIVSLYTVVGKINRWPQTTVLYEEINSYTGGRTVNPTPLLYFEAPLLLLVMLLPFIAVCVAVGMYSSLRAKGVLGAIVPSVAIIGFGALVFAFCGLTAAENIPLIGPALNAFSPATNLTMLVDPHGWVAEFEDGTGSTVIGRVSLVFAAIIAAAGYATIVWAFITTMVKGFDHTVRRLSGTK